MVNVSLLALLVFLGIGCGSNDKKKTDAISNATELEGKFTKACGTDTPEDVEPKTYTTVINTFQGTNITVEGDSFSDSGCTVKLFSSSLKGTFTIGEALTSPSGAKAIDLTPTEGNLTVYNEDYVKAFNGESAGSTKVCEGGWVLGQAKKLTKALCKDGGFSTVEDKKYDLFKLDGKNLFFGDTEAGEDGDGTSAAKRPKVLQVRAAVKP